MTTPTQYDLRRVPLQHITVSFSIKAYCDLDPCANDLQLLSIKDFIVVHVVCSLSTGSVGSVEWSGVSIKDFVSTELFCLCSVAKTCACFHWGMDI